MIHNIQFNKVIKIIITMGDLCILNCLFILLYDAFGYQMTTGESLRPMIQQLTLLTFVHLLCNYSHGIILDERIVRPEHIVRKALRNTIFHAVFFISLTAIVGDNAYSVHFLICFYSLFFFCLSAYRLVFRYVLKKYRLHGGNSRTVVLAGGGKNMAELCKAMSEDPTTGFRIKGYFNDTPSDFLPEGIPYLGKPHQVLDYLQAQPPEELYCSLPSAYSREIVPIINYCESHLIRFYSVPNIRNYLHRRMHFQMFGNIPLLTIHEEPLMVPENRLLKRAFDLLFSGLFLCTVFPFVFIIVGIAIKLSSPGPILFKQKRSGENGKEFWCYKFRSMRVNANSDRLQATIDDPRKTKVGVFLRKTSIDELPQFLNVFLGQMSVVGPRPHMLKHTEEYSRLIHTYMVRHLIKPGITGWAQVTGFRGETKELWQMEGRVQRDVWYIEHWTFMLDLYIIYKSVKNGIQGDKEAY